MKRELTFVTGFCGAPIEEEAERLAKERAARLIFLDKEIQQADGRSVLRICMLMGEHEYRNQEYKLLARIVEESSAQPLVICCGDGVLLDEMSRQLILPYEIHIVGSDLDEETLWQSAKMLEGSYHAFLSMTDLDRKRSLFCQLYQRQKQFYDEFMKADPQQYEINRRDL